MEQSDVNETAASAAARLALALDEPEPPPGPRPDIEEIRAWHQRRLHGTRADEVKAHVARDPACYRLWLDLIEADGFEADAAEDSTAKPAAPVTRLLNWLKSLFPSPPVAVGAAAVAVLAAALGLRLLLAPALLDRLDADIGRLDAGVPVFVERWPVRAGFVTKGIGDPWAEPAAVAARAAFAFGVREQLVRQTRNEGDWSAVIDVLPRSLPDCAGDDPGCASFQPLLQWAGRWTSAVVLRCQADRTGVIARSGGVQRLAELSTALRDYPPAADLSLAFAQWQGAVPDPGDAPGAPAASGAFCAEAAAMLANALDYD